MLPPARYALSPTSAIVLLTLLGCSAEPDPATLTAPVARNGGSVPSQDAGSGRDDGDHPHLDAGPDRDGDLDEDGIRNADDNCREVANPDQADQDGDGWGDACDNCALVANVSQETVECKSGGIGEDDSDGDQVVDAEDNCALLANFDQLNTDGDLYGDACDNCPRVANDDQANVDDDLLGDACDEDLSDEPLCAEGSNRAQPLEPNLYFLFDTSGSMGDDDIRNLNQAVTNALRGPDGVQGSQDDLVNHFNVGMATFPSVLGSLCFFEPQQRLALRDNNSSTDLTQQLPSGGEGGTPTAAALGGVLDGQLFVLEGETPSTRPAAIVLMTDGSPNDCGGQSGTVQQASRFASIGVPVYVIAYQIGGEALRQATQVATAGSLDPRHPQPPLEASDAAGIEAAFSAIRTQVTSCTFPFEAQNDANFDRVQVSFRVDGTTTELVEGDNGYRLNVQEGTVELTGSYCDTFKRRTDGSASVHLAVACKAQCEPMPEVCDFRDNNCDGNVDEGCTSTPPEVCNGVDDDSDGDVDEGCPIDVI